MHKIFTALILLLFAILDMSALPADYRTGRLFDDPTVVSGSYTGFCQDKEGYIWIGTNRGLLRFDGNAYDVYRHEDIREGSLSDSRILAVFCDSKGRVWVATANGLNLYQPETDNFKVVKLPSKTFYGYIIAINEQADGTVTFIASGVGLYVINFKEDDPVAVQYTYSDIGSAINHMVCCDNGKIYFGTHSGIVYCMAANGSISKIKVTEGAYVVALSLDEEGNVLVGTLNDVFKIDTKTHEVTKLALEEKILVNNLSNSHNGKVYVATSQNGLMQIRTGSDKVEPASEIYCPFVNLAIANIGAAYSAPDGNLWIGCNYVGLVMVPGKELPFTYKRINDDFQDFNGGISAMALWKNHVLVALNKGRVGVFATNGKMIKSAALPSGGYITSIEVIGDKALLGVIGNGIWEFDIVSGSIKKFLDVPGKYPAITMARGKGNDLFIGVHGEGLMRYNMATNEKILIPHTPGSETGLSNPFTTSFLRAGDKLWVGTFSGLACYDLNTNKMLEVDQIPFLNGTTFTMAASPDGSVYAGTSQGLIHYDLKKGVVKSYTMADGLTDNDIRCIVVDKEGGKWIGTVRGLSYLTPDDSKILSYYGGYGLVENAFNHALYSEDNDRVYLGNDLGMTSFRPKSVPSPGFGQNVMVSAIYLNGERILPNSDYGSEKVIEGSPMHPKALNLPSQNNALTLRLSTMDFRDASNISYMWRMSGRDEWIKSQPGHNMINLPYLDPGDYNLEVCAVENNTMSDITTIKIHVAKPWYWNNWSRLVYFIILLVLMWLIWTAYKKKRDEKINEDKIKFFMDISHDLRSPMTLIKSPLESLMKQPLDKDVLDKLHTMHRNVGRVMTLVNQLLDIRKLEKGKMHLHCKRTDVNEFIGELVEMFRPQAEEKNQTIMFEPWEDNEKVWIDRNNFDKILVNLISNAIKYTPDGGNIEVRASSKSDVKLGNCLCVSVNDTGVGLDSKTEAKLFERFYRVEDENTQSAAGFGIGLDLCRRLVMLHHGAISGKNRDDGVKGSVFSVLIPLDNQNYDPSELIDGSDMTDGQRVIADFAASPAGDLSTRPSPLSKGKYILFVDDDAEMRAYVSQQLGRFYKVRTAPNGVEAMKMIGEGYPDIVVSDVMMPEMDGLTLLKRLKARSDTNYIPVILLSSKNDISDRMAGWDKGADGYIGKPFNIEELDSLIGTLIENRQRMKGKYSGAQETDGKINAPEMKGNDENLMERVVKEINLHIDDPQFNVETLSDGVGVSRTHLHRKMKDIIGMTPSDYIRNIRLKRACELLKRNDIEVTQVAYKIGFASQSHFSTHFKRYTGYSPSEYRAKCLSGDSPEMPV